MFSGYFDKQHLEPRRIVVVVVVVMYFDRNPQEKQSSTWR